MANKADNDVLSELHQRVAHSMVEALKQSDCAAHLLAKERDEPIPDDVIDFLENIAVVNPALLTAATKFLKDNKITAEPGADSEQSELQKRLDAKRKRLASVGIADA